MKICPKCETETDMGAANFCGACGTELIFDPKFEQIAIKVEKYTDPEKCGFKHEHA